ncbi:MAG: hypothetical protein WC592_00065 [Candidatus Omnitrophota bacterium]|nr:hypothetical protein [Candidatus Omnitrophota bacterium]
MMNYCHRGRGVRARAAVTLIELIIAAALAAMVGMAVYKILSGGITLWRWHDEHRPRVDAMIFLNRMAYDLSSVCDIGSSAFNGDSDNMTFFWHDTRYLAFHKEDVVSFGKEAFPAVRRIEYVFMPQKRQIRRRVYRFGSRDSETDNVVLSGVNDCRFDYYFRDPETAKLSMYGFTASQVPNGVKITIRLSGSDPAEKVLVRTIEVPFLG